jgi:hypothetical protein
MEPEAVAYAEAVRSLDQQRRELDSLRTRAATTFAAAGIVSSFFAGIVLDPGQDLNRHAWVAVVLFCGVGLSAFLIQWPWKSWKWIPPGMDLVRDYVDGESRVDAEAMQRDLAINLGENHEHNQKRLDRLHFGQMAGIVCLALEVLFWLLAL